MSGLSLATVIVEAGETSGALRQADFALKQKRQVI
jgi:DNA processing protein